MSECRIYGYSRVSSADQNSERQIESLKRYVPFERDIYVDKVSGKDLNREQLQILLNNLRDGDTLYVHALDRLGRNKTDIKNLLEELRQKKVTVRILDIPTTLVDYSEYGNMQQNVMDMVNNVVIEVMALQAENERINIRKRQAEGIEIALKKGVRFGRKPAPYPDTWEADYRDWKAGKVTAVSLYKKYGWSNPSFYRKVKEYEKEKQAITI